MGKYTNKKETVKKVGRPKKILDKDELIELCKSHCTVEECCSEFEVSEDTLSNFCKQTFFAEDGTPLNFSEVYRTYSKAGNTSLRRKQREIALNGNVEMLKWVGKNCLLQSDNPAELAKSAEQESRIQAILTALMGV